MEANENWTHFEANTDKAGLSMGEGWSAKVFCPPSFPPEPRDQTDLLSERAEKAAQCTEPKTGGSLRFCGVFGGVHVEVESLQKV